jgi:inward rectifier potassium channel
LNNQEIKDSGFSDKAENLSDRVVKKDGGSNIKKLGLSFFDRFDLYHSLISMKAWQFFATIMLTYIVINLIFATGYVVVGIDKLVDSSIVEVEPEYLRAFFFSSQTLTTLGYGQMSPTGIGANIIASIEAFIGLLMFALLTGLLYGRFSRPKAKLMFSTNALISPYQENSKGLMVRLANPKNSNLINVNASYLFSYIVLDKGEKVRKYFNLDLEIKEIKIMAASWTLVHPLGENSPLKSFTRESLRASHAELIVQIEGYDETYNQQVSTRTSYTCDEVVFDAKFVRILKHNDEGALTVDLGSLSDFTSI